LLGSVSDLDRRFAAIGTCACAPRSDTGDHAPVGRHPQASHAYGRTIATTRPDLLQIFLAICVANFCTGFRVVTFVRWRLWWPLGFGHEHYGFGFVD
jgi:hypothetical protein